MSVEEAAAQVQRGLTLTTPDALASARALFAEALAMIAPLAAETARPELPQAAAYLAHVLAQLERTQATLAAARQTMTDLATAWVGPGGGTISAAVPIPGPNPTVTDQRAADLLAKLPERGPANRKTSGYWVDDDGIEHGPLVSGQQDGYKEANEELRRLGIAPARGELWTAAHVEVKLAVRLRRANARHVTLVVNKRPCSRDIWSCDELLPQILRSGQQLTVYWPDGGKRTYRGREA